MRPAKTQINLGIRTVWSESSMCAQWIAKGPRFFMRTAETLIRLGGCPGWSESSLGAHSFYCFCHVAAHICCTRCISVCLILRTYNRNQSIMYTQLYFTVLCHIQTRKSFCNISFGPRQANLVLNSLCEQRRFRRACASAQSRQNLRCSLIEAVSLSFM